ncbi:MULTISPECIES: hypothetical protein [Bacteria]|uniref:hypothetical protein n=1 Tax=Bacteria TaxID=2 RepID=UPI00105711B4|nr:MULTISPECIES: hypothetical protein [Bacteria]
MNSDLMRLTEALYHLRAFRQACGGEALADARSGLTTEDLDVLVGLLERIQTAATAMVVVPRPPTA